MALAPTSYPSRAPLLPHFPSYCSFLQESLVLWGPTWAPALLENQYGSTPFLSPGGTDSKAELLGMLSGTGRGCKGGPTRNLLQKRLLWLLGHQVGFPGLTAALAAFFFICFGWSAGSQQAGGTMLMTLAPRGDYSGGKKLQCSLCHINQRNTSRAGCMETAFLMVPALRANHLPSWR